MTDDIVALLHARNKRVCYSSSATYSYADWNIVDPLCGAAADEIERLRAALDQLLDDMGEDGLCVCQQAKDEARAALEGEKTNA